MIELLVGPPEHLSEISPGTDFARPFILDNAEAKSVTTD